LLLASYKYFQPPPDPRNLSFPLQPQQPPIFAYPNHLAILHTSKYLNTHPTPNPTASIKMSTAIEDTTFANRDLAVPKSSLTMEQDQVVANGSDVEVSSTTHTFSPSLLLELHLDEQPPRRSAWRSI
jgi:hypothetical protein